MNAMNAKHPLNATHAANAANALPARNDRLRRLAFLALVCACFAKPAPAGDPEAPPQGPQRPNLVWLISEDNSKHFLKLFDPRGAATPRIAELASQGVVFTRAFSNSPVCSVARTTLMTGCYAPRIGTQYHRRAKTVPLPGDLRMFPAYLREAGYYASNNRKKDYNAEEGAGVWDVSSTTASWRGRRPGQPFFHMQSFGTTHESSLHFTAAQRRQRPTVTDPDGVLIPPCHPDTPLFRYTYASYLDRIAQMDGEVGEVVDQLRQDGLLEDTIVFYFGDHGGVLPGSKGYLNERGLHVPLVVRIPQKWQARAGRPTGRAEGFVSFVDFAPTMLALAGIAPPQEIDGRPFLGRNVDAGEVDQRDTTFGYADRFDEKYDLVRTMRQGDFKYVRSYQPFNFDGLQNNYRYQMLAYQQWRELFQQRRLDAVQRQFFEPRAPEALYDLARDPYETVNLAGQPAHNERLVAMREALRRHVAQLPDLSFYPESWLVAEAFDNPTRYGQRQRAEIARLVEIADLSLRPFEAAREPLAEALQAANRWERYWALIACSAHGESARPLIPLARQLAKSDGERLVRTRAAEFLALIGEQDPAETLLEALRQSESDVEATLILNTVTLLRDGPRAWKIPLSSRDIPHTGDGVKRRLQYLKAD